MCLAFKSDASQMTAINLVASNILAKGSNVLDHSMTQRNNRKSQNEHIDNITNSFVYSPVSNDAALPPLMQLHPQLTLMTQTPTTPSLPSPHTMPAFLNKLYGMVNCEETDPWVHWSDSGQSFIIPNSQALAEQVLGCHFKHNNFASFVRQLNMYGFRKVPHLNHGILYNDGAPEVWEFTNENFRRDEPGRMRYIYRKRGEAEKAKSAAAKQARGLSPLMSHLDPEDLAVARAEIRVVANRQMAIKQEVDRLANSTESLWKYALETRKQCGEQQKTLHRLLSLLEQAFRKRVPNNTEAPRQIRGLIEGPIIEELPEISTPRLSAASPEPTQDEVMRMIAAGKVPIGFLQEAISQAFRN
jgi:HSF-type DNA-binding